VSDESLCGMRRSQQLEPLDTTSASTEALQRALGDEWVVEGALADSANAQLHVATQLPLHRRVVLKALALTLRTTRDTTRFRREIELTARLAHPNIVPLLAAGEGGGFLYYTMPLLVGESLYACIRREHAMPFARAVVILRDLARALEYAHAQGVVHRDVKPDNVLLVTGAAMLTDFGIATVLTPAGVPSVPERRGRGRAVGTPTYVSPEQAAGEPRVDHRTDLYSLGVLAYELLTGHPPFRPSTLRALLASHRSEPPPPIRAARPDLPEWLGELVMQLLEKRPDDRPQSAADVLRLLEGSLAVLD
jgi:serine/threonine protein kinase